MKDYIIFRLKEVHRQDILNFYLSLDSETLHNRFFTTTSKEFIETYVNRIDFNNGIFGVYDHNLKIIGIGECILVGDDAAEIGIAVKPYRQNAGIGDALLKKMILFSQARHVHKLHMYCLRSNSKMQHLARKNDIRIIHEASESYGSITYTEEDVQNAKTDEMNHDLTEAFSAIVEEQINWFNHSNYSPA